MIMFKFRWDQNFKGSELSGCLPFQEYNFQGQIFQGVKDFNGSNISEYLFEF